MGGGASIGRIGLKTLSWYVVTSMLAIVTGLLVVNVMSPGVGADIMIPTQGREAHTPSGFWDVVVNMVPTNVVEAAASFDMFGIITFALFFGIFLLQLEEQKRNLMIGLFEAGSEVMMKMTMAVIALAPFGVAFLMLNATALNGTDVFVPLAWYMLTVLLALLFHACVTLPVILKFVGKRDPLKFARAMSPALLTAFSSASSNGTLPLTMASVEKRAQVSNQTSSFVLPLGATINMDGTALYEAVAVLFIAQHTMTEPLSLGLQITVALTALLVSIGAAGIPHAGLVMMVIVLQAVGLPLEMQGLILAVDRVLDMFRTSVNVWSDSCGCAIIDRFTESGSEPVEA